MKILWKCACVSTFHKVSDDYLMKYKLKTKHTDHPTQNHHDSVIHGLQQITRAGIFVYKEKGCGEVY